MKRSESWVQERQTKSPGRDDRSVVLPCAVNCMAMFLDIFDAAGAAKAEGYDRP
jgi:hypothetical protein